MGEAARRARSASLVSILIPERGRPESLDRLISSLIDTAGGDDGYEIIVQYDDDDPAWRERTPREHSRTTYLRRPRAPTLGEKLNQMALEARGGIIGWLANDTVMATPGWPQRYRDAAASLPNGIGIMAPRDPLHPDHASYPAMTRAMYDRMGCFCAPWFPYWFIDTWADELGRLCGLLVPIDVDIAMPDGNQRGVYPDLAFWIDVFEATRPMRLRDAVQLVGIAYGRGSPEAQQHLASLAGREAQCRARTAHMQSPAFVERWGTNDASALGSAYPEAKEIAARLVADIRRQVPRKPRVAFCIPSGTFWVATTANCVAACAAYSTASGIDCSFLNVQSSQISNSRNKTVEIALEQGMDALFWVDSDMRFDPSTLIDLMKHNRDVVCATYHKRTKPYTVLGRLKGPMPPQSELRGGLHEAELMPAGVMLVNADVYRKIPKPWYAECYRWPGDNHLASFKAMMRNYYAHTPSEDVLASIDGTPFGDWIAAFGSQSLEDGETFENFGEDNFACRLFRRHGYKVWCDLDVTMKVAHIGQIEVTSELPPELQQAAE